LGGREEFICIVELPTEVCVLLSEDELGLKDGGIKDVDAGAVGPLCLWRYWRRPTSENPVLIH
jgi:hypothetical protein